MNLTQEFLKDGLEEILDTYTETLCRLFEDVLKDQYDNENIYGLLRFVIVVMLSNYLVKCVDVSVVDFRRNLSRKNISLAFLYIEEYIKNEPEKNVDIILSILSCDFYSLAIESGIQDRLLDIKESNACCARNILSLLLSYFSSDAQIIRDLFLSDNLFIGEDKLAAIQREVCATLLNAIPKEAINLALTNVNLKFCIFYDKDEFLFLNFDLFCQESVDKNIPEIFGKIIEMLLEYDLNIDSYAKIILNSFTGKKIAKNEFDKFKDQISQILNDGEYLDSLIFPDCRENGPSVYSLIKDLTKGDHDKNVGENKNIKNCLNDYELLSEYAYKFATKNNVFLRALLALAEYRFSEAYELIREQSYYRETHEKLFIISAIAYGSSTDDPEQKKSVYKNLFKKVEIESIDHDIFAYDYFSFLMKSGMDIRIFERSMHPDLSIVCGEDKWKTYDNAAAYSFFKKSFQYRSYPFLYYYIGRFYDLNLISGFGLADAIEYYRKAAQGGIVAAMYRLGCIYRDDKEYEKSFLWFNKAANLGHQYSFAEVAKCYYYGRGVIEDKLIAAKYGYTG